MRPAPPDERASAPGAPRRARGERLRRRARKSPRAANASTATAPSLCSALRSSMSARRGWPPPGIGMKGYTGGKNVFGLGINMTGALLGVFFFGVSAAVGWRARRSCPRTRARSARTTFATQGRRYLGGEEVKLRVSLPTRRGTHTHTHARAHARARLVQLRERHASRSARLARAHRREPRSSRALHYRAPHERAAPSRHPMRPCAAGKPRASRERAHVAAKPRRAALSLAPQRRRGVPARPRRGGVPSATVGCRRYLLYRWRPASAGCGTARKLLLLAVALLVVLRVAAAVLLPGGGGALPRPLGARAGARAGTTAPPAAALGTSLEGDDADGRPAVPAPLLRGSPATQLGAVPRRRCRARATSGARSCCRPSSARPRPPRRRGRTRLIPRSTRCRCSA